MIVVINVSHVFKIQCERLFYRRDRKALNFLFDSTANLWNQIYKIKCLWSVVYCPLCFSD